MRRSRLILTVLVAAAATAAAVWYLSRPLEVRTVALSRGPAVEAVYATGIVEPSLEIRIAPRAGGRLVELQVDEGQKVRSGQLLARLEDTDLRASVAELQARADYAQQQFERNTQLRRSGLVAADAVDRARTDLDAARATLRRAREQASFMRLVAPAAGTVIRRDGEIGEFIPQNQTIFYLAGEAPLRISADVDEEDLPRVRPGMTVLIRSDAFPDRVFEGRVSEVTPRGDPVSRSYRVRIAMPQGTGLAIGMTVETNVVIERRENALLAPTSAVAGDAVWVLGADGRPVRRTIVAGVRGPEQTEVREGLAGEERLIDVPPADLTEQTRVRVRDVPAR